ncbi:MAG: XdhC family protein [Anaerolineales bacterium]|nr:XdhC family protein [Anaerolineales bacterium]
MRDVIAEIKKWRGQGKQVALATVLQTWGSSPRAPGATLAVSQDGEMAGSVSGGCVEGAVVQESLDVLQGGVPRLLHFGVADETAWDVGLACGGNIDIFVKRLDPKVGAALVDVLSAEQTAALVSVIQGPDAMLGQSLLVIETGDHSGNLESGVQEPAITQAKVAFAKSKPVRVQLDGGVELFVEPLQPPPKLIIVGGVHIAVALVSLAETLGYHTVVIDPRRQFGSPERFPHADELVNEWPDEAMDAVGITTNTAVTMLTHDPKIDDPGLVKALPSMAFYVGALGGKQTQASRRERMLEAGLDEESVVRLKGPIGLDLGGRSPEEIALAILAEIVQVRNQA